MSAVILHRIDPVKNMRHFYMLDVQPDLFGQWCFIREWGRIGKNQKDEATTRYRIALHRELRDEMDSRPNGGKPATSEGTDGQNRLPPT